VRKTCTKWWPIGNFSDLTPGGTRRPSTVPGSRNPAARAPARAGRYLGRPDSQDAPAGFLAGISRAQNRPLCRSAAQPSQVSDLPPYFGGRTRTRTWDPLIKSQLLYQLSYAPENAAPPKGPVL
jgi:hypothetical protein